MIAALLAVAIAIGSQVSWKDQTTGFQYCGKLTDIDHYGRAWVLPDLTPYNYAIVWPDELTLGCSR